MNSGIKLSMAIPDSCPQLFWVHEMEKMHWIALLGLQYHSGCWGIACQFPMAMKRSAGRLSQALSAEAFRAWAEAEACQLNSGNSHRIGANSGFMCKKGTQAPNSRTEWKRTASRRGTGPVEELSLLQAQCTCLEDGTQSHLQPSHPSSSHLSSRWLGNALPSVRL